MPYTATIWRDCAGIRAYRRLPTPGTRTGSGAGAEPEAVDAAGPWWPGAEPEEAVPQAERVVRSRVARAAARRVERRTLSICTRPC
ncbi:protein of unknown function [Streptomyces murinus]